MRARRGLCWRVCLRTKAWQDDDVSQDRGGGSGQNIPHLFGPGTPVLVSVERVVKIHGQIRLFDD